MVNLIQAHKRTECPFLQLYLVVEKLFSVDSIFCIVFYSLINCVLIIILLKHCLLILIIY